jgi:hypothetical protein
MLAGFLRSGLATWNYQTVHAPAARCLKNQHRGVKIIPYLSQSATYRTQCQGLTLNIEKGPQASLTAQV